MIEAPLYHVLELPIKSVEETQTTGSIPSSSSSSSSQLIHSLGG